MNFYSLLYESKPKIFVIKVNGILVIVSIIHPIVIRKWYQIYFETLDINESHENNKYRRECCEGIKPDIIVNLMFLFP